MLERLSRELRFVLRRLRRRPIYAALTVLTLSLGVAGTAAVYGIARPLLFEPLPYGAEEEVVVFWNQGDWRESEFEYLRPEMGAFRSVAAYRAADVTLQQGDAPARLLRGVSASAELFQVLGVSPALGPGFRPGDDRVGAEPVAVISQALWRELGRDRGIIGQRLELAGVSRTVVGVMPERFWFPDPTVQVWLSEEMDPENNVGNYALIARMPPGARLESMVGQVDRITALLRERFTYPEQWDKTRDAVLTPLREVLVGPVRPALLAMLVAMGVILLIACVNVAALMLGQVDSRGSELAVRAALGAERRRLLGGVLLEALVIGALAGIAGAALAVLTFRFLRGALPLGGLAESAALDWSLFAAAMTVALIAASAIALVPGVSLARSDPGGRLARARTGGVVGRGGRLEGALVVAQVALVLLMAAGAALLMRSVANLRAIDTGLQAAGVGVVDVLVPGTVPPEQRPQLTRELIDVLASLPGVVSAGAAQPLPLRDSGNNWGIEIEGQPNAEVTTTYFRVVSPDYFATMGIRLRSGRGLLESDRHARDEGVVVINQALADRYFAGVDPIGRRIAFMPARWDRIVGVVENVAEGRLVDEAEPARYTLYEHVPWLHPNDALVFRAAAGRDVAGLLDEARRAVQAAHPTVAIQGVTTMESVVSHAIGPARQVRSLLALLGGLALALGVIGVYGVVSHFVARRTREWGIRLALGLRPARVIRQIVGQGTALVGTGIGLGLVGFLLLANLLASFLYDVRAADPVALLAATVVLLTAGLLAALFPAWRASRIDPVDVLREQ